MSLLRRVQGLKDHNNLTFFQAAQRVLIEDRTRVLAEEQEQLRQQLQNMANTQKKVEDAIKKRRKR